MTFSISEAMTLRLNKVGIVEDGAEEAFGEQVLHEHFIDRCAAHVGIKRGATEFQETGEGGDKGFVVGMFLLDALHKALRQVGDAFFEVGHGMFKGGDVGGGIVEEGIEYGDEFFGVGQVYVEGEFVVLVEDGTARVLKDGVGDGVARADLFADLDVQVVFGVLGFPVATWEVEAVAHGAIGAFAVGEGLLWDEHPVGGLGEGGKEVLKGTAHGSFVGDFFLLVSGKFLVIVVDGFFLCWGYLHTMLCPSLSMCCACVQKIWLYHNTDE